MRKVHKDKQARGQQSGFTIIELLVVLAIVSGLMLGLTIMITTLNKRQRNQKRHNDVVNIIQAIQDYRSNSDNPTSWDELKDEITDLELDYYDDVKSTATPANSSINLVGSHQGSSGTIAGSLCGDGTGPAVNTTAAFPTTAGAFVDASTSGFQACIPKVARAGSSGDKKADQIVIYLKAICSDKNEGVVKEGGLRQMAIVYSKEGVTTPVCLDF